MISIVKTMNKPKRSQSLSKNEQIKRGITIEDKANENNASQNQDIEELKND